MAQTEAQRRWYERNRDRQIERSRLRRLADPASARAYQQAYYQQNRARLDARNAEWEKANPERARAIFRESARRQRAAGAIPHRARLRAAMLEVVVRQVVWERDGGICGICGHAAAAGDWHLDHVIPLARGGEHSYANTQVAHPACNLRKGARTP